MSKSRVWMMTHRICLQNVLFFSYYFHSAVMLGKGLGEAGKGVMGGEEPV